MSVDRIPGELLTWTPYIDEDFQNYRVYIRERRSLFDARETTVASITGCVTESTRGLGTEGDGRAFPDNSVAVVPGVTNRWLYGSFEDGSTTGFTTGGTNTLATSTAYAKFGLLSGLITYSNNATILTTTTITVAGAGSHVASFWIYIPSTYNGTDLRVEVTGFTSSSGTTTLDVDMTKTNQWQRLIIGPFVVDAGDLTGVMRLYENGSAPSAGRTLYVDGFQVEAGIVATPFVVTLNAVASRASGRLLIPTDVLSPVAGSVTISLRVPWTNSTEPLGGSSFPTFFDWREDANNRLTLDYDEANNRWRFTRVVASSSASITVAQALSSIDTNVIVTIYWTTSGIGMSINGATATTTTSSAPTASSSAATADIGSLAGGYYSHSDFYWVVFTDAVPDSSELAALVGYGTSTPSPEDLRDIDEAIPLLIWDARLPEAPLQVQYDAWKNPITITDASQVSYTYDRVKSGRNYEFAVTVTADIFGDVLESEKQSPPIVGSCTFTDIFIQEVGLDDPHFATADSNSVKVDLSQNISYIRPRGRIAPSAQIGEFESHKIQLSGVPKYHESERDQWERIFDLVQRQRTIGSVLLLRLPHVPERYFVQVDPLSRNDDIVMGVQNVNFMEVFYDEG